VEHEKRKKEWWPLYEKCYEIENQGPYKKWELVIHDAVNIAKRSMQARLKLMEKRMYKNRPYLKPYDQETENKWLIRAVAAKERSEKSVAKEEKHISKRDQLTINKKKTPLTEKPKADMLKKGQDLVFITEEEKQAKKGKNWYKTKMMKIRTKYDDRDGKLDSEIWNFHNRILKNKRKWKNGGLVVYEWSDSKMEFFEKAFGKSDYDYENETRRCHMNFKFSKMKGTPQQLKKWNDKCSRHGSEIKKNLEMEEKSNKIHPMGRDSFVKQKPKIEKPNKKMITVEVNGRKINEEDVEEKQFIKEIEEIDEKISELKAISDERKNKKRYSLSKKGIMNKTFFKWWKFKNEEKINKIGNSFCELQGIKN
jgi:hypothetical protein